MRTVSINMPFTRRVRLYLGTALSVAVSCGAFVVTAPSAQALPPRCSTLEFNAQQALSDWTDDIALGAYDAAVTESQVLSRYLGLINQYC